MRVSTRYWEYIPKERENMTTKERQEILEIAKQFTELDEPSRVLIKNGIALLSDRQRMEEARSQEGGRE